MKSPQFSFQRLPGSDPLLGVEMSSTGEVGCFGDNVEEAYLKSIISAGFRMPDRSLKVMLVATPDAAAQQIEQVKTFVNLKSGGMQFTSMDPEVSAVLEANGVPCDYTDPEDKALRDEMADKKLGLVLDFTRAPEHADIRRACIDFQVPLFTDMQQIAMLGRAMELSLNDLTISPYSDYTFD